MQKAEPQFDPMYVEKSPLRKDVVGQSGQFIDDFLESINSEQLYYMMGVKPDKTFLITGSHGNGKTLSIEALVNEANKEMFDVSIKKDKLDDKAKSELKDKIKLLGFKYDIGKHGTAYINKGSRIVQDFFDMCYRAAGNGYKTLIVFDEADNLFGHRTNTQSHKEDSKVLATIMKNLQTVHDRENLYSVMMSNFEDAFDEASIRAGRIDKKYVFKKPTLPEREFAYIHTIDQINKRARYKVVRNYNTSELSKMSNEFSYADIVESVNSAVKQRVKELSKVRKNRIITAGYISQKRLETSINKHKTKFVATKKSVGFK